MCGVFGFIAGRKNKGPNVKRLMEIASVTESRGHHAFGFSWIDGNGRLRMFKQTGKITDHLALLAMASDARMLIGHCRYATHGDPTVNENNHPHPADGGWLVHNGVIGNVETIIAGNDLTPVTECDSEVLGLLIEQSAKRGYLTRSIDAVTETSHGSPLSILGLWKPGRLVAVRRGNPLHVATDRSGTYLASLPGGMPANVKPVRDGSAREYTWCKNAKPASRVELLTTTRPARVTRRRLRDNIERLQLVQVSQRNDVPAWDDPDQLNIEDAWLDPTKSCV